MFEADVFILSFQVRSLLAMSEPVSNGAFVVESVSGFFSLHPTVTLFQYRVDFGPWKKHIVYSKG